MRRGKRYYKSRRIDECLPSLQDSNLLGQGISAACGPEIHGPSAVVSLRVGGTGKLKGRSFRVLGRLSYAHEKGTWDEWFIVQDGNILWLTEDEGELFLETPLELTSPVPPYSELSPGMQVKLNDKVGMIEELGEARCLGGEGEIPFQVEIGETYPYADGSLADEKSSFGLEYDAGTGNVRAFIGRILDMKDSRVRPEDREAPVNRTAQAIRCPSCGKPYEGPRLESTRTVVCNACGSGLALDEAEMRVLGEKRRQRARIHS